MFCNLYCQLTIIQHVLDILHALGGWCPGGVCLP